MSKKYTRRQIEDTYNFISMEEAVRDSWIPYSGPYKIISENWMVRRAVADILANKRDKYALVKMRSQVEIWILPSYYRMGYVFNNYGDDDQVTESERAVLQGEAENKGSSLGIPSRETFAPTRETGTMEGSQDAPSEQGTSEVAEEVFEGEGGTVKNPELVRPLQKNDPLEQI